MNAVRTSGLKSLLIWGAITLMVGYVAKHLSTHGWQIVGYGWGVPGAFALAGLVQLVSGVEFSELSSKWGDLQGWQRGVLGTLIVLGAFCLLILGMVVFL
jgi:hypothetical protein